VDGEGGREGGRRGTYPMLCAICPSSVFIPVAVTMERARPRETTQPKKAMFLRSPTPREAGGREGGKEGGREGGRGGRSGEPSRERSGSSDDTTKKAHVLTVTNTDGGWREGGREGGRGKRKKF